MYKKASMIGRALMLPIAILPAAGLLLGIGSAFSNSSTIAMFPVLDNDILKVIFDIMKVAGNAIFSNIAILFAIGITVGLAKKDKGAAAVSACVGFLIFKSTFTGFIYVFTPDLTLDSLDTGVLGAFSIGITVAFLHNRYCDIELPSALGFFGGNRFIPIISAFVAIIWGLIFALIWPPVTEALNQAGNWIAGIGPIGSFFYGFLMRLCGAVGLHHAIYPMFWYTELGGSEVVNGETIVGAQNIFFAQMSDPNFEGLFTYGTRFFAGRFATMMFGIPAVALAMYHSIPKENREKNKSLYSSGGLTSFLTGITEPVEYTFLFVAPWLYVIHAILDGISFFVADILCIRIGNAFSAGLIDFILFGVMQGNEHTNWVLVIPVGICFAIVYYVVFRACIKLAKVPIPGMEHNITDAAEIAEKHLRGDSYEEKKALKEDVGKADGNNKGKTDASAKGKSDTNVKGKSDTNALCMSIIAALGAQENIESVESCATRLRVSVKDGQKIDEPGLRSTGALAVINKNGGVQVVYGPKANIYSSKINEIIGE